MNAKGCTDIDFSGRGIHKGILSRSPCKSAEIQKEPMKTKLASIVLAIFVHSAANADCPEKSSDNWYIQGKVAQLLEGGILVFVVKANALGMLQPKDASVVFVAGKFPKSLIDDDQVALDGAPTGNYRYMTVTGAARTTCGFRLISLRDAAISPLPPHQLPAGQ